MEDFYSIKQAAEILKVSTPPIPNIAPVKNYPVTPSYDLTVTHIELKEVFKLAIKEEVDPLRSELSQLRSELNSHFQRQDERFGVAYLVKKTVNNTCYMVQYPWFGL